MSRISIKLRNFFFPPEGSPLWVRLLPYAVLGILTILLLTGTVYAWDYTNSPEFCGTACHTMPPEFTAYLTSPHARVDCVECHIGRGFVATRVTRKAGDAQHIISLAFRNYEFPIQADDLRPARETCERCHFPEKFSDDSLREIKRFLPDRENTETSIYLTLKTGGGSKREGLGRGIHWHVENQVFYYSADPHDLEIPFVRVINDDGTVVDYMDLEANLDPDTIDPAELKLMDCITCHNRITHFVLPPDDTVDLLLARKEISTSIPEIRLKAVQVYEADYETLELALNGIAGLRGYYEAFHPDFYAENEPLITQAIESLQKSYGDSVFPEQRSDWDTHPNHAGHKDSPGCLRCHDGKHLNPQQEAIRLECNLCHSIPVVAGPNDFVTQIEISRGPEPETHLNPNWITLHRDVFDASCENCHTIGNPGGTDNTSFCSNSACHGNVWEYAGFDAPGLREILSAQLPEVTVDESEELLQLPLTYVGSIQAIFTARCLSCHGPNGIQGLNLSTYSNTLVGGQSGPALVLGDPEASLIIQKQQGEIPHFGQFTLEELSLLKEWIEVGAPEN